MNCQRTVRTLEALQLARQQTQKTTISTARGLQLRRIWAASRPQNVHASSITSISLSPSFHPRRTQSTASESIAQPTTASPASTSSSELAEIARLFQISRQNKAGPYQSGIMKGTGRGEGTSDFLGDAVGNILAGMGTQPSGPQNKNGRTGASRPTQREIIDFNNPSPSILDPPTPAPANSLSLRLGPVAGRTITVNEARNMDVGRAFKTLQSHMKQNNVRNDFMRQRFHERPGMKRKRLKMERWRTRFREQFRLTVNMVQRMKRQGW